MIAPTYHRHRPPGPTHAVFSTLASQMLEQLRCRPIELGAAEPDTRHQQRLTESDAHPEPDPAEDSHPDRRPDHCEHEFR